jgi:broad specificity phosphatase PhoE
MARQTILIIRHADKPEPGGDGGVDAVGVPDKNSLTPRGWQRAGIWAELFAPSLGQQRLLPKPSAIFASAPASKAEIAAGHGGSKSRRPLETISPLAAKLGIDVDLRFAKGQEADLAAASPANGRENASTSSFTSIVSTLPLPGHFGSSCRSC